MVHYNKTVSSSSPKLKLRTHNCTKIVTGHTDRYYLYTDRTRTLRRVLKHRTSFFSSDYL